MGVNKFIKNVIDFLKLDNFEIEGKKKSLKTLLSKLKKKRVRILKALKEEKSAEKIAELEEELNLISVHIIKGKKKLNNL